MSRRPVPLKIGDKLSRMQAPKQGTKVRTLKGKDHELDADISLFRKHF
ncbi:MAG: hypothetical protein V3W41_14995 [Planctomycetota bacterium]